MKRIFFNVLAFAAVLTFGASCTKEDPAKPLTYDAPERQATIYGTLLVNDDLTAAKQKYTGAAGVAIIATISYSDLSSGAGATSGAISRATTTNSKGEFAIQVPATEAGVSVSFTVNDLKGKRTETVGGSSKEVAGTWRFSIADQRVKIDQEKISDTVVGVFTPSKSSGDEV
ncbi:MAG: hypothetical protein LBJ57_05480 [Prevotellaceae bacterium]|nr:hypothetical protein [Prevotellaceae bacterium]